VVAPFDELGAAIRSRYGDRVQRIGFYALEGSGAWTSEERSHLIASTRD
jgi:erythromycin esterase-like protein